MRGSGIQRNDTGISDCIKYLSHATYDSLVVRGEGLKKPALAVATQSVQLFCETQGDRGPRNKCLKF